MITVENYLDGKRIMVATSKGNIVVTIQEDEDYPVIDICPLPGLGYHTCLNMIEGEEVTISMQDAKNRQLCLSFGGDEEPKDISEE
ncbi:MAG: hypothetical protein ACLQNE_31990 [Thermoguttaceae bacterium]